MGDTAEAERQVISNLQALYAQASPASAKAADKWLKDFQLVSPLAWSTSDRILHNTALPYEVHFYAASTLYIKIQYLASIDLNPQSRLALRDSLISHISTHSKGMEPLRSKLAQSIAVLALHMGAEWPNVVNDLVATLTRTPDLVPALFSVMEILPEESENYHSTSRVSKEAVAAFRAQIRSAAPGIIRNFGDPALIGNSKDSNVQAQIMKCFGNWLRVCEDSQVPNALSNNQLVISVFDALNNSDLFDAALSAVCELVLVSTQNELRQLMEYAVSRAQSYLPAFKTAVKDEDEDTFKGLCHLFTEMAETYLPIILVGDSTVLPLVEVMLECVAHTEVDVAAITFRFWQLLAEGLAKSERKDIVAWFATNVFPRLFEHLYRLACYPDDYATWPTDLQEDFREVRKTEVTTTLRTTCSIMESSACFAKLASILEKQLAPTGYATTGNWRLLEGAMYCMRALARCVDTQPGTDPMVGSILKIVPQLPNHKEIHYTSLLIVGRYADWLKTDPSLLWPLFSYVVIALGHSDTAPSAAVSFKNICGSCAKLIADTHLQDILQIATNSMQSNQLHVTDHVEVLDGVAQVISTLPFDSCVTSLQTLCLPLLNSIRTHTPKSETKSTQLADSLCKLATLFLCTQTFRRNPDRTAPIVEAIWPILEPVFTTHASDSAVIDQLFRCVRYLLDNFPASFEPSPTSTILPTLFSLMKSTFRVSRNPAILYTASAFIKYNSHKPYHIPLLWDLLLDFSYTVLKAQTDAVAEAELAGEYCMLMEHAAHDFAAQIRATAGLVDGIVGWCSVALGQIAQLSRQDRHQREAFYSICRLLSAMIQEGQDFTPTGEGLMRSLFSCMALCGISLTRAQSLCDIMRRLVTQAPAHASAWVSAADATLPAALPPVTKAKFLNALAEAAKFPITDSENGNSKTNGASTNGKANGHSHLAEDAERTLTNTAMDLADMCKKYSRT